MLTGLVVDRLPLSVDQQVGTSVSAELLRRARVDEERTALLQTFFQELGIDGSTQLHVIHGDVFNAFALPDNRIIVLSPVFNELDSPEQLTALLCHEYAHIKHRHGLRTLGQAMSWGLLAELFSGGGDGLVQNANMLLQLKNSRYFEYQADRTGLELMTTHHIDPNGMVQLLAHMQTIEAGAAEQPSYLSTHPDTRDRLAEIQKATAHPRSIPAMNERLRALFDKLKEGQVAGN